MRIRTIILTIVLSLLFASVLPAAQQGFTNKLGMKFVYIKPGRFIMGSPSGESGRGGDETQHRVTFTKGFYMQTTEVTQGQWEQVMGSRPWSSKNYVRKNANNPAVYISWNDCQAFIQKLNQMEGGNKYRLPTEAEWEYACRAGSAKRFSFGTATVSLGVIPGMMETQILLGKPTLMVLGPRNPMSGGFTTCTAMCGSGAGIGMGIIRLVP